MLNPEVYCNIPYSSLVINPDGSYRLCSLTNRQDYDMGACKDIKTGQEMNVMTHSFEDALGSRWHTYLRTCHAEGKKSELCECCYNRDAISGNSRRTHLMRILPANIPDFPTPENSEALTDTTGKFTGRVRSLDLRFGNLCNYKCIQCGPWYSDKWYDEYQDFNKVDSFAWNGKVIPITGERLGTGLSGDTNEKWWESDVWHKRFSDAMPYLRHIYFTGGEPMLIKEHEDMLQALVDGGIADKVVIELDTNLSALNDNIMRLWSHFKKVDLRVSLDDVGERYNTTRFPGNFTKVDANLKELTSRSMPNVDMLLTSCIMPTNVFYIHEIEDYNKKVGIPRDAHFRFVDTPSHFDIRVFSIDQRRKMVEHLSAYTGTHKWPRKVIQYLRSDNNQHLCDEEAANKFFLFMDYLDRTRGTNWRAAYPETASLMPL